MEMKRSKSNAALQAMRVFIGEWETEISSIRDYDPSARFNGQASFHWAEGGAFVLFQADVPNSEFPKSTALMGPDDSAGTYCMLYFDSRGVSRIYQMSLNGNTWNLWRDFPEFSQRFTATFNEDYNIIDATWEMSPDGKNWKRDFNIIYTRIGAP